MRAGVPSATSTTWDDWHRRRDALDRAAPTEAIWRTLAASALGAVDGLRVIDLGCARGGFDRLLADRGAEVTAVDWSPVAIDLTRAQLGGRGQAVVADLRRLPFPAGSFDAAVCLQTLDHVEDREAVVAEMRRVMRSGGRAVVTVSNPLSLLSTSRRLVHRLRGTTDEMPPRAPTITVASVRRLLRRHGVVVDGVTGAGHGIVVPGLPTLSLSWLDGLRWAQAAALHVCLEGFLPPA